MLFFCRDRASDGPLFPAVVSCLPPAAYFLSTATKSMQKTPPKTNGFWISFCVQELHPNSRRNRELTYFYSRCRCIGSLKGIAVLSWQSVLPSDRRNISFTRAGAAAGLLLSQFPLRPITNETLESKGSLETIGFKWRSLGTFFRY